MAWGVDAVAHDERLGRTLQVPVADALVCAARQSKGVRVRCRQVQSAHGVTRVLKHMGTLSRTLNSKEDCDRWSVQHSI